MLPVYDPFHFCTNNFNTDTGKFPSRFLSHVRTGVYILNSFRAFVLTLESNKKKRINKEKGGVDICYVK